MAEQNLSQRNLAKRSLLNLPNLGLPAFWEDIENNWAELAQDQGGLTLSEDEKNYHVEASLPGLKDSDIDVTLDKGILRIRGEKKETEEDKEKRYFRRASSSFSYRITLPGQIDEKGEPNVNFENGILHLTFPKAPQAQTKKITVRSNSSSNKKTH